MIPKPRTRWQFIAAALGVMALTAIARHAFSSPLKSLGLEFSDPSEPYLEAKELMESGTWKQANTIITITAFQKVGREDEGWFDSESMERFPCPDLHYIDSLFSAHSDGRFGLTAQREVYEAVKTENPGLGEKEIFLKFAERVGWMKKGFTKNGVH